MPWYPWHIPSYDIAAMSGVSTPFTAIASVSRLPGHTELFWINPDGSVMCAWFYGTDKPGGTWQIAPPGSASNGSGLAAASRAREYMEIFWAGPRGSLQNAYWCEGITDNKWHHRRWFPDNSISITGGIELAVDTLEKSRLFYITTDARIQCTRLLYQNSPFQPAMDGYPEEIPNDGAAIASGIAHTHRKAGTDEIQWVAANGSIQNAYRYDPSWSWNRFEMAPAGSTTARSGIWAASRRPETMDIFWVGKDGSIQSKFWFEGIRDNAWGFNQIAPPGSAFPVSGLAAISRLPNTLELWWVGPSGSVESAFWYEGDIWRRHQLAKPSDGNLATLSSRISAIPQYNGTGMGVFYVNRNMHIRHHFFRDIREKVWPANIVSGGAAALGGWVNLTIRSDGSVWWRGQAHDSGADKYNYFVTAVVTPRDPNLPPLAFPRTGRVQPTKRSDSWGGDQLFGYYSTVLQQSYEEYANGRFDFYTEYNSSFAHTFEAAFGFLAKWILGEVIGGPVTLVIFIAVEIGSLAMTGSLVPGARIISGLFFMAGPDGTLLALGTQALINIGSNQRELTEEEYNFCKNMVYGPTSLPPRSSIVLCDTIGQDDRPFCWPAPGGKISINIGRTAYNDPRSFKTVNPADPTRVRLYGETLIHEMAHVWQITHGGIQLFTLIKAIRNQIAGKTSYEYGPPNLPFREFTLEAQGDIIAHWAVGRATAGTTGKPGDPLSPYYKYIIRNVQPGQYSADA